MIMIERILASVERVTRLFIAFIISGKRGIDPVWRGI